MDKAILQYKLNYKIILAVQTNIKSIYLQVLCPLFFKLILEILSKHQYLQVVLHQMKNLIILFK